MRVASIASSLTAAAVARSPLALVAVLGFATWSAWHPLAYGVVARGGPDAAAAYDVAFVAVVAGTLLAASGFARWTSSFPYVPAAVRVRTQWAALATTSALLAVVASSVRSLVDGEHSSAQRAIALAVALAWSVLHFSAIALVLIRLKCVPAHARAVLILALLWVLPAAAPSYFARAFLLRSATMYPELETVAEWTALGTESGLILAWLGAAVLLEFAPRRS